MSDIKVGDLLLIPEDAHTGLPLVGIVVKIHRSKYYMGKREPYYTIQWFDGIRDKWPLETVVKWYNNMLGFTHQMDRHKSC